MRRPVRLVLVGAVALASVSALVAAGSGSPASATSAPVPSVGTPHLMKTLSSLAPTENRLPLVGGAPVGLPLQYGGGPVEVTNTNYAIFWEPTGSASPAAYKSLITRFFTDLAAAPSPLFGTTTQYYQTTGSTQQNIQNSSHFGGSVVVTDPFPAGGVTDAALQAEVTKVVQANGWPTGVGNEYFVYSGPGGETVSSYCAYHSYVTINGNPTPYADEPYGGQSGCTTPTAPNDPAADSAINTTSHELWETITDPLTGNGWTALDGDEGSDQCNFEFGSQDARGADVYLNGHPYIVQQEWSNAAFPFGCVMS